MSGPWRAYFPDESEDADDATILEPKAWKQTHDAEDAAQEACLYHYSHRDGYKRGEGDTFTVVVISPDGTETGFEAHHERSVRFVTTEIEDEE